MWREHILKAPFTKPLFCSLDCSLTGILVWLNCLILFITETGSNCKEQGSTASQPMVEFWCNFLTQSKARIYTVEFICTLSPGNPGTASGVGPGGPGIPWSPFSPLKPGLPAGPGSPSLPGGPVIMTQNNAKFTSDMSRSCWDYRKWSASRCHCLFSYRLVLFGENVLVACSAAEWWWWHLIMGLIWHHKVSGKHHICKSLFWCHPLLCNTTFTMIPHMTGLHFLLRYRKIWCLSKYFYILSFGLGGPHLNFGVDIIFVKVHQNHLFSRYEDISPPNAAVNGQLELTFLKGRQRFDTVPTSNLKVYKFREWWIFT